ATINNSFTLTVTNPAPVVAAGGIADIVANDAANVMVNAGRAFSDPDGDLLVFDGEGLPAGLEINPATGVITGTLQSDASQSGPYLITVTSTDSQGSQTQVSFFLTALNTPVTAVSIPNATVNLGQEFPTTGADVFSDLDGDELFITAVNLPDGLQIDSQTGVISGSIAKTVQPGDYRVAVTATDSEGGTVSVSFVITVPEQGTRTPENFVSDSYQSDPRTETQHNDPTQGTRQTASTVLLDALEQIQSLGLMGATGLDTPILDTNDQLDALQRQLIDVQTPNFTNTFPIILELSEGEEIASDFTANVLIGTNRVFYNIETVSGVDLELDPEFAPAGVFIASEGGIVVERWVSEPFVVIVKTINGDEATYSEVRIDPQQNQFEIIATEVRKLLISERLEWQPSIY
ncbi:Ig domain-containing protein, partial [Sulfitobacter geojensis]|uniref:Ig domain-containing protein n=1 Tax=Sulfitobacter geojensis TaxID=1342299 RepID=UPI00249166B4